MKKIVLAGGGVLGSQIAFQSAYCGFDVTIWLRSEGSIGRIQPKLDALKETYTDTINLMATPEGQTPEKYFSLHFANSIWKNNMAEIMAQPKTEKKYFDQVMEFVKDIRMIPLPVHKEKSGYC